MDIYINTIFIISSAAAAQLLSRVWLCNYMDYSPSGSVHGIFQARILEWIAIASFRASSQSRDQTCVSCIGKWILYHWATWEAPSPQHRAQNNYLAFLKSISKNLCLSCVFYHL